jgi:hypothetical protein
MKAMITIVIISIIPKNNAFLFLNIKKKIIEKNNIYPVNERVKIIFINRPIEVNSLPL